MVPIIYSGRPGTATPGGAVSGLEGLTEGIKDAFFANLSGPGTPGSMKASGANVSDIVGFGVSKGTEDSPALPQGLKLGPEEPFPVTGSSGIIAGHGQALGDQDLGNQAAIRKKEISQKPSVAVPPAKSGFETQRSSLHQLTVAQVGLPGERFGRPFGRVEFRGIDACVTQMFSVGQDHGVSVDHPDHFYPQGFRPFGSQEQKKDQNEGS